MSRIDDQGRPLDLAPLKRGVPRAPILLGSVLLAGLVLAVAKPWTWGQAPGSVVLQTRVPIGTPVPTRQPTPEVTSDVLAPHLTPAPTGEGLIQCLRFDAWRLLTISRAQGKLIRTWTAFRPVSVDGPDEVVDFTPVSDGDVLDVGYCGPVALLPGAAESVTVTAWRRPASPAPAVLMGPLHPAFPSGSASRALFLRPAAIRTSPEDVWPAGRYVLHLVVGRPNPLDVWFGVEIVAHRG